MCEIVHETCHCIVDTVLKEYIRFPSGNSLQGVVDDFKSKWGVPQCVGAIDGCHVPISAPHHLHTDYYNRKGWYSMLIQELFMVITVSWMCVWDGLEVYMMPEYLHNPHFTMR